MADDVVEVVDPVEASSRMKELDVEIRVRNNRLRERRLKLGLTQAELCKAARLTSKQGYAALEVLRKMPFSYARTCRVLNCKREAYPHRLYVCDRHLEEYGTDPEGWPTEQWPLKRVWSKTADRLAKFYKCAREELFPEAVLEVKKPRTSVKADVRSLRRIIEATKAELLPPSTLIAALPPDEFNDKTELSNRAGRALATLTPREEKIIRMRFGFGPDGGDEGMTLQEVAEVENVKRERIRQIEAKALRKLRHPSNSNSLKEFAKVVAVRCTVPGCKRAAPFECTKGAAVCLVHRDVDACGCSAHAWEREAKRRDEEDAIEQRQKMHALWIKSDGKELGEPPPNTAVVFSCNHGIQPVSARYFKTEKPIVGISAWSRRIAVQWIALCSQCADDATPITRVCLWGVYSDGLVQYGPGRQLTTLEISW